MRVWVLGVGDTGVYMVGFGEKLRLVLNRRKSFDTTKASTESAAIRAMDRRRKRAEFIVWVLS